MGADNQEVLMSPATFNAINQADPNEQPPTERKTRKGRKSQNLRVGTVEVRQTSDGMVADAVLLNSKEQGVGVATLEDSPDGRIMRVEGAVDSPGIDLAAKEIFRQLSLSGEQTFEMRQITTRTVTVDSLPSAKEVLHALRGDVEAAEEASPPGSDSQLEQSDDDGDAAIEVGTT